MIELSQWFDKFRIKSEWRFDDSISFHFLNWIDGEKKNKELKHKLYDEVIRIFIFIFNQPKSCKCSKLYDESWNFPIRR